MESSTSDPEDLISSMIKNEPIEDEGEQQDLDFHTPSQFVNPSILKSETEEEFMEHFEDDFVCFLCNGKVQNKVWPPRFEKRGRKIGSAICKLFGIINATCVKHFYEKCYYCEACFTRIGEIEKLFGKIEKLQKQLDHLFGKVKQFIDTRWSDKKVSKDYAKKRSKFLTGI